MLITVEVRHITGKQHHMILGARSIILYHSGPSSVVIRSHETKIMILAIIVLILIIIRLTVSKQGPATTL